MEAKRTIVIGVDGLMGEMIDKFVADGVMPNLEKLLARGSFAKALPSPPAVSATNWASVGTGAWTGTHGVTGYAVHYSGEPFEKLHCSAADLFPSLAGTLSPPEGAEPLSAACRAEFLWQAAARAGRKTILVNWPGGWPGDQKGVLAVAGSGPYSSPLCRLCPPHCYATKAARKAPEEIELNLRKASGWAKPPLSKRSALETGIVITGESAALPERGDWFPGESSGGTLPDESALLYLLVVDSKGSGYDRVLLYASKDGASPLAELPAGGDDSAWSDWITAPLKIWQRVDWEEFFPSSDVRDVQVEVKASFRCSVRELSPDGKRLRLACTSLFNRKGWTSPEGLASELIDHFFVVEQTGGARGSASSGSASHRQISLRDAGGSTEEQAKEIALLTNYLAKRYEWDLLMVQIHAPDRAQDRLMNAINPYALTYVEADEEWAWETLAAEHRSIDAMIGEIVDACADDETLVAVVSSHATLPVETRVWLPHFFQKAGLTAYVLDEGRGEYRIDWAQTRAVVGNFPLGQGVWVNLKGRDPYGIVAPGEEYELVRAEAARVLSSVRDPRTDAPVLAAVFLKEDATVLGQWGDRVGDLVFYFRPGYADYAGAFGAGPIVASAFPREPFVPVVEKDEAKGRHDCYLPTAELAGFSVCGVFLLAGPGVRKGFRRPRPVWMVDVAPTVAAAGGLPMPAQSEGNVVATFLDWSRAATRGRDDVGDATMVLDPTE